MHNEDVRVCLEQLNAVCARQAEVNALPQEATGFILEGFSCCSVVEFCDIHKLLATALKVCQMRTITGKRYSSTTLAEVQKLCSEACEVFHSFNLTNKWNIPQSRRATCYFAPLTTAAHWTTPAINSLFGEMRPKSQGPRRPVLRPQQKGMVAVEAAAVVAVVAVAGGGLGR